MSEREIMNAKFGSLNKKRKDWEYSDTKVTPKIDHMPDQYRHKQLSLIKSAIRILGFGAFWFSFDIAATLLILAEIVGIGEELV